MPLDPGISAMDLVTVGVGAGTPPRPPAMLCERILRGRECTNELRNRSLASASREPTGSRDASARSATRAPTPLALPRRVWADAPTMRCLLPDRMLDVLDVAGAGRNEDLDQLAQHVPAVVADKGPESASAPDRGRGQPGRKLTRVIVPSTVVHAVPHRCQLTRKCCRVTGLAA